MSFQIVCVKCKKNAKTYVGFSVIDSSSWICGQCWNTAMQRIKNLESAADRSEAKLKDAGFKSAFEGLFR